MGQCRAPARRCRLSINRIKPVFGDIVSTVVAFRFVGEPFRHLNSNFLRLPEVAKVQGFTLACIGQAIAASTREHLSSAIQHAPRWLAKGVKVARDRNEFAKFKRVNSQRSRDTPFVVLWSDIVQGFCCREVQACGTFDPIFVSTMKGPARTRSYPISSSRKLLPGRRLSEQCIRKYAGDALTPIARRSLVSSTRPAARAAGESRPLPRAVPSPGRAWPRRRPSGAGPLRSASCVPLREISARRSRRSG